ncbi:MAG: hypothetical protein QNJ35_07725 [Paracoccaceae bacterium]|nr:hypothetical protein [Paracoccaceae bacterium]
MASIVGIKQFRGKDLDLGIRHRTCHPRNSLQCLFKVFAVVFALLQLEGGASSVRLGSEWQPAARRHLRQDERPFGLKAVI